MAGAHISVGCQGQQLQKAEFQAFCELKLKGTEDTCGAIWEEWRIDMTDDMETAESFLGKQAQVEANPTGTWITVETLKA